MLSLQDIDNIVLNGGTVVDSDGEKIGSVEQIFTSGDSGDPAFVTVRTGLFGMSESFAPLFGASIEETVIRVAFAKDTIKNGPRIDSNRGVITATQEQELYRYYGLAADAAGDGSSGATNPDNALPAAGATAAAKSTANTTAYDRVTDAAGATPAGEVPHPSTTAYAGPPPDGGPPHPEPHPPPPPDGGPPHPEPHPPAPPHGGPPPSPPHLRKYVPPGACSLPAEGAAHPPRRPPGPPHPEPGPNQ
jgi:hypothetical protein